jgi:2-oxoglutarate ferredoxin oxidoreductase subunit gamma
MSFEIIVCGFGGQGVIFAAELIGRAGVLAGLEAAESGAYGAEARGSACHAGIILAKSLIAYPKVRRPDLLIALSRTGYDKFISSVNPGGRVVYDSDLIKLIPSSGQNNNIHHSGFPATATAGDLGRRGVANVVITAAALALSQALPFEALQRALKEQCPPAYLELDLRALEAGWKMGEEKFTGNKGFGI